MTEQPDTAAIRARRYPFLPDMGEIIALCDALDAARAAAERANAHREGHALAAGGAIVRAEAAEAQVREDVLALDEAYAMLRTALARAKVAEARIAAALAWFADTDCTWTYRVEMARRALTEGTGQ